MRGDDKRPKGPPPGYGLPDSSFNRAPDRSHRERDRSGLPPPPAGQATRSSRSSSGDKSLATTSLSGRNKSMAGIITSAVLGPLIIAIVVVLSTASYPVGSPGFSWVTVRPLYPPLATNPLPAALTHSNSSPGAVVLPAQAKRIFTSMWVLRNEAFSDTNRSLMAEFETGPALEADESSCGCETRAPRGPILREIFLVPMQSTYPATFLGEATTTLEGSPYVQFLIISKPAATSPWQVVSDPGFGGTATLDQPIREDGGYDGGSSSSAPQAGNTLPVSLANYWQTWTDDGHAPASTNFAPGQWTTQEGRSMTNAPQGATVASNQLEGHYRFRAGASDEVWDFPTSHGSITCGVIRDQTLWTAPGGGVYQPLSLKNWGGTVAPGLYRAVADTDIVQPCFHQRAGKPTTVVSGIRDPDTLQGVGFIEPAGPVKPAKSAPSPYGSPVTGQLQGADVAIVGIDRAAQTVTLDNDNQDVSYTICPTFGVVSTSGEPANIDSLGIGDIATVNLDMSDTCLDRVSLLTAPQPPTCNAVSTGPSYDAVWVGYNEEARSVVYSGGNGNQAAVATRWCQTPTVVAANGSATTLAGIPPGTEVQLRFSVNMWVTGVKVVAGSTQPTSVPAHSPVPPV
jgi:hypothetical protein